MEEEGIDLYGYLGTLRKRWKIIALGTILCTAVATAVSLILPKMYEATATLSVFFPHQIPQQEVREAYAETLENLITSYEHADKAVKTLGLERESRTTFLPNVSGPSSGRSARETPV